MKSIKVEALLGCHIHSGWFREYVAHWVYFYLPFLWVIDWLRVYYCHFIGVNEIPKITVDGLFCISTLWGQVATIWLKLYPYISLFLCLRCSIGLYFYIILWLKAVMKVVSVVNWTGNIKVVQIIVFDRYHSVISVYLLLVFTGVLIEFDIGDSVPCNYLVVSKRAFRETKSKPEVLSCLNLYPLVCRPNIYLIKIYFNCTHVGNSEAASKNGCYHSNWC